MTEKETTAISLKIPKELLTRIEAQRKKEGRNRTAFILRVLDRYILEQEFRGQSGSGCCDGWPGVY